MRKGSSKLVESLHVQSVVHTAIRFYPIPETVALLFRAAGPRMHSSRMSPAHAIGRMGTKFVHGCKRAIKSWTRNIRMFRLDMLQASDLWIRRAHEPEHESRQRGQGQSITRRVPALKFAPKSIRM